MTLNLEWGKPYSLAKSDVDATDRYIEFSLAWFADPLYFGEYPKSMVDRLGDRLPKFTAEQSKLVKGSGDFFGINHYSTWYVQNRKVTVVQSRADDMGASLTAVGPDGKLVGPEADSPWLHVYPLGIYHVLKWIDGRYSKPVIFITENGVDVPDESTLSMADALQDTFRYD